LIRLKYFVQVTSKEKILKVLQLYSNNLLIYLDTTNNSSYHFFYENKNGFKGLVAYSIRELSKIELNLYCNKNNNNNNGSTIEFPKLDSPVNFTNDFMIRSFTSGCYYYDTNKGKWYSDGMSISKDTNLEQTHCSSSHFTLFAGGLVYSPSTINIEYLFVKTVLTRSFLAFYIIVLITCAYILFVIWSHYMDIQDEKKMNLVQLKENNHGDSYFYEIIVFTGTESESGTQSKVRHNL
jgi:hypothetical protein